MIKIKCYPSVAALLENDWTELTPFFFMFDIHLIIRNLIFDSERIE